LSFKGFKEGPKDPLDNPYVGATETPDDCAPALIPSISSKLDVVEIEFGSLKGTEPDIGVSEPAVLVLSGVWSLR